MRQPLCKPPVEPVVLIVYSVEGQFVFIRSLDIIEDGLYAITYDDGYCIVGNYTDKELVYNGMPVSAHNFRELKKVERSEDFTFCSYA